jgi:16S rRNA (cytidine1402-2'-O)-methyltransferase
MSCPPGTLYIVGIPIGHPDDITLRALATLRHVTVIASEDPRATQMLLSHHGITATITSYGPQNRHEKIQLLLHRLIQGHDVALVSDNGTPVIYDPGSLFVAAAHEQGIPVKAIPGPSIVTTATALSGFSGDAIVFEGCLPSTSYHLTQYLLRLRKERRTVVCCIDPLALARMLKLLTQVFPTRQIAIAMNLTTERERLSRGKPDELLDQIGRVPKDSAVTIVIEGFKAGSNARKLRRRMPRAIRPRGGG